jgi:FkbM family methyltransferase
LRIADKDSTELAREFRMLGRFFRDVIIRNIDVWIGALASSCDIVEYRDHHFFSRLDAQSLVVDLGAHKGEFSSQINCAFGCRCVSVEANPDLFNGMAENPCIQKFHYAICAHSGPVCLYLSDNLEATSVMRDLSDFWGTKDSIQVPGINFEEFLEKHQIKKIDLLKVDIEGMEIELFESMSDATIRGMDQIAVEFHGFCNAQLSKAIPRIKKRLRRLGFLCLPFPFRDSLSLDCDTLFVKKKLLAPNREGRSRMGISFYGLRLALFLRAMMLNVRSYKSRLFPP